MLIAALECGVLVGVDRRSLSRWRRQGGQPRRSLRIFARLVAILRPNWDEEGNSGGITVVSPLVEK